MKLFCDRMIRNLFFTCTVLAIGSVTAQQMQKAEEPREVGLVEVSEGIASIPSATGWIELADGAVSFARFSKVDRADAPGKGPVHSSAGGVAVLALDAGAEGATPYVFSFQPHRRYLFMERGSRNHE